MLTLYVEAPFAACRTFTAGWYRPTATFLTPSAAYGLLLNIAGIESRLREEDPAYPKKAGAPATLIRAGLPRVRLAVGKPAAAEYPRVQTVFQQLHNYPVGKGNKVDDPENPGTKVYQGDLAARRVAGNKPNITPVRREFLSDLKAVVAIDGNEDLEARVRAGLTTPSADRYGVPFLGDNAFLIDRLHEPTEPIPANWYERVTEQSGVGPRPHTTRLTYWIDRADLSQTKSALYAPAGDEPATSPSAAAWTDIEPPS
jgi:CRISPR-associated protein Cas5t